MVKIEENRELRETIVRLQQESERLAKAAQAADLSMNEVRPQGDTGQVVVAEAWAAGKQNVDPHPEQELVSKLQKSRKQNETYKLALERLSKELRQSKKAWALWVRDYEHLKKEMQSFRHMDGLSDCGKKMLQAFESLKAPPAPFCIETDQNHEHDCRTSSGATEKPRAERSRKRDAKVKFEEDSEPVLHILMQTEQESLDLDGAVEEKKRDRKQVPHSSEHLGRVNHKHRNEKLQHSRILSPEIKIERKESPTNIAETEHTASDSSDNETRVAAIVMEEPATPAAIRRPPTLRALEQLAEDGENYSTVSDIESRKQAKGMEGSHVLSNLLEIPAKGATGKILNQSPGADRRSTSRGRQSPQKARTPPRETRAETPNSPSDFRINPEANNGIPYAYLEVVRGKKRKCLPSCLKPCCAQLPLFAAAAPLPKLKQVAPRFRSLSPVDDCRNNVPEHDFVGKFGKHKEAIAEANSPPGYWRSDFPSTQELERDRSEADRAKKKKVQVRQREAEKGGLYIRRS